MEVDVGVKVGGEVKVERVVIVGVAVEDVDVDDAGGVRPPQVQAPFVPRGIYRKWLLVTAPTTSLHYPSTIPQMTRLLVRQCPLSARTAVDCSSLREVQGCREVTKTEYLRWARSTSMAVLTSSYSSQ